MFAVRDRVRPKNVQILREMQIAAFSRKELKIVKG